MALLSRPPLSHAVRRRKNSGKLHNKKRGNVKKDEAMTGFAIVGYMSWYGGFANQERLPLTANFKVEAKDGSLVPTQKLEKLAVDRDLSIHTTLHVVL